MQSLIITVVCGLQDVLKGFMANTATKSATVQIMDDAIKPLVPVSVNQACMGDSAISVRHSNLNSEIPQITLQSLLWYPFARLMLLVSCICPIISCLECPKWSYGPGCSAECQCVQQTTLECHRRYGTCVCKPGYQGKTCSEG